MGLFSPFLPFFNLYLHSSLLGQFTFLYCSEKHVALSIQIERTFDLIHHVLIYCVTQFGSVFRKHLHWIFKEQGLALAINACHNGCISRIAVAYVGAVGYSMYINIDNLKARKSQ